MFQFRLPDIGEGVAEAEIVAWKVRPGDRVERDQMIVEVVTDKATVELPSPRAGIVRRLYAAEGQVVAVGEVLIEIDEAAAAGAEAGGMEAGAEPQTPAREADREAAAGAASKEAAPEEAGEAPREEPPAPPRPQRAAQRPAGPADFDGSRPAPGPGGEARRETGPEAEAPDRHAPPPLPPRPQARPVAPAAGRPELAEAVPAVRALARELGVDLARVRGSGPGGRVMRRDVEAFQEALQRGGRGEREEQGERIRRGEGGERGGRDERDEGGGRAGPALSGPPAAAPAPDEPDWRREPLRGVRRQTAEHMARALAVPHFTYVEEVDVSELERLRRGLAADEPISPLAFIAAAALQVLPRFPQLNAFLDDRTGEIVYRDRVHLGIAVNTEAGLLVPVIRDAGGLSARELGRAVAALAARARERKLEPAELKGATFTITSLGKLGGVMATPIINVPAAAILGVHAIRTLPRYVGGRLRPRQVLNLSISLDHRIVDGYDGARFLQEVREILQAADFPELRKAEP